MEKKIITISGKTFVLIFDKFDSDMEIDDFLKIDYSNLIGEMITFPVIVNRFGQLLAEAESQVSEAKLNLEVFEAKTKEKLRLELSEANNGKMPTVEALNNAITANKAYLVMRKKFIEVQKTRDYVNSIFWSSKDKSDKISVLFKSGDITLENELSECKINGMIIKKQKNSLIK